MKRRVIKLSKALSYGLAYVGVVIGAGFASGAELMQYYVAFGTGGIWGMILAAVIYSIMGLAVMQLGSYYEATDHSQVIDRITHPILAKLLDLIIIITLLGLGIAMIAGAGAAFQQQFGWEPWIGSIIVAVLVILTGLADTERVTQIIGSVTPLLLIMFLIIAVMAVIQTPLSVSEGLDLASQEPTTLPNWVIGALNQASLNSTLAFSMVVVMGGSERNAKAAGQGGVLGGIIIAVLQFLAFGGMVAGIEYIPGNSMPMLELANVIHPWVGNVMTVAIFLMVFNTAVGVIYPFVQRVMKGRDQKYFNPVLIVTVIGCFILSFAGFDTLVNYLYPFLGYIGLLLIAIILYAWWVRRKDIEREREKRMSVD